MRPFQNATSDKIEISDRSLCLDLSNQIHSLRWEDWRQAPGLILSSDLARSSAPLTSALSQLASIGVNHHFRKDEIKLLIVELLRHISGFSPDHYKNMIHPLAASIIVTAFQYSASSQSYNDKKRRESNKNKNNGTAPTAEQNKNSILK